MNSLGFEDDLDLTPALFALEQSFGVKFDRVISWMTVGDAYDALLAHVPTYDWQGKCATSMAFFRLRRALRETLKTDEAILPDTRLCDLASRPPKRLLKELSRRMDLPPPPVSAGVAGVVGASLVLLGSLGCAAIPFVHGLWPSIALILIGIVAARLDHGSFGRKTVGDLARDFANRNFGEFAKSGADQRPAAIWSVLVALLKDHALNPLPSIDRETRLWV